MSFSRQIPSLSAAQFRTTTSIMSLDARTVARLKSIAIKTAVAALWLVLWQLVCVTVNMELLVVSPLTVARRLFTLGQTAEFWRYALGSLGRIMAGFALGGVVGTLLAVVCSVFRFAREFFSPAITVIKSTPVASFIILALVWLTGRNVPIFIAFLMVLPVIYANVFQGIREVDPQLLEMAAVYDMSRRKRLTKIYIPSVMPYFMAASRTALGLAWKAGVAAEVIGVTRDSVGRQLYYSKIYLETADLFAWTAVVIIMSLLLETCYVRVAKALIAKFHLARRDS
jgi:NitT/TauT family transport system permease protein